MKSRKRGYNLCNKSHLCKNNLNFRRKTMPQFDDLAMKNFITNLKNNGTSVKKTKQNVLKLNPTQNQINSEAVKYLQNKHLTTKYDLNKKTIMISKDNFILDGHHRWAALILCNYKPTKCFKNKQNLNISCYQINLPIKKIIKLANNFDQVKYKSFGEK